MFKLEIETDNDAFGGNVIECWEETARILADTAAQFRLRGDTSGKVRDINGNTVGRWEFTP